MCYEAQAFVELEEAPHVALEVVRVFDVDVTGFALHDGSNDGEMKNWAKRSNAVERAAGCILLSMAERSLFSTSFRADEDPVERLALPSWQRCRPSRGSERCPRNSKVTSSTLSPSVPSLPSHPSPLLPFACRQPSLHLLFPLYDRQSRALLCLRKRAPSSTDEGRVEQVEQRVLGVS
jgi:hypothetical protein